MSRGPAAVMAEGELGLGRCGPDCRLSQRASAGARPPVCRQGPLQVSVDPSLAPLLSLPPLQDPEIADPSDCPPVALLSSRGKNERGPRGTFSLPLSISISLSRSRFYESGPVRRLSVRCSSVFTTGSAYVHEGRL